MAPHAIHCEPQLSLLRWLEGEEVQVWEMVARQKLKVPNQLILIVQQKPWVVRYGVLVGLVSLSE